MRTIGNPRHVIVEQDGSFPVILQDQTTPAFDVFFMLAGIDDTLAVETIKDSYTITVTDGTKFTIGQYIVLADYYKVFYSEIINIAGNVITTSDPMEGIYVVGTLARPASQYMNVDGSVTRQDFSIRNASDVGIFPFRVDVTRIMLQMTCAEATPFNAFGDIAGGLTNGIVLRKVELVEPDYNFWNAKDNSDLALLAYDLNMYTTAHPQAVNGIAMRYTFAGQDKHGVAVRLDPGESLQFLIQDDLSSLLTFRAMAQGHVVTD